MFCIDSFSISDRYVVWCNDVDADLCRQMLISGQVELEELDLGRFFGLIIFNNGSSNNLPVFLQTVVNFRMLSIGGQGRGWLMIKWYSSSYGTHLGAL